VIIWEEELTFVLETDYQVRVYSDWPLQALVVGDPDEPSCEQSLQSPCVTRSKVPAI
jgi:hypothetical protein